MGRIHPKDVDIGMRAESVLKALQSKPSSVGELTGNVIAQQFWSFLSLDAKRLDVFLHDPTLSSGVSVRSSFSCRMVGTCNIQQDTVIAQRLVCDYRPLIGRGPGAEAQVSPCIKAPLPKPTTDGGGVAGQRTQPLRSAAVPRRSRSAALTFLGGNPV
ncbi:hypothetical protein N1851_017194 [Merluccius polli]|uniref:Uncharacterized protein n=1 Tax=Merluccius polli TaxID=89951 RepID=A0AA47MQS6_MERPO|nr:hypothetical protein N1851_017194 [Merluccius polli]